MDDDAPGLSASLLAMVGRPPQIFTEMQVKYSLKKETWEYTEGVLNKIEGDRISIYYLENTTTTQYE